MSKVTKKELVQAVQSKAREEGVELSQAAVGSVVDALVSSVVALCKEGHVVPIPNLGTFKMKTRAGKKGKAPNGVEYETKEKKYISFQATKSLKDM